MKRRKIKILDKGIFIPLRIGDMIAVGKFKNKKIKVKSIGVDDNGYPIVNGRKILTFRYHYE